MAYPTRTSNWWSEHFRPSAPRQNSFAPRSYGIDNSPVDTSGVRRYGNTVATPIRDRHGRLLGEIRDNQASGRRGPVLLMVGC